MSIRILHCTAILIFVIASPLAAAAADLTCPSATTLDGLVSCIRDQMPGSGSNGFVFPSATQKTDWRWIVRQMLGGSCDFQPPASLSGIVKVRTFTDSGNGESYCVLMEVQQQPFKIPIVPLLRFTIDSTLMRGKNWRSSTTLFGAVSGS